MAFNYEFRPDHGRMMQAERARLIAAGIIDPNGISDRPKGLALTAAELDRRGFPYAAHARRAAVLQSSIGGTFTRS